MISFKIYEKDNFCSTAKLEYFLWSYYYSSNYQGIHEIFVELSSVKNALCSQDNAITYLPKNLIMFSVESYRHGGSKDVKQIQ